MDRFITANLSMLSMHKQALQEIHQYLHLEEREGEISAHGETMNTPQCPFLSVAKSSPHHSFHSYTDKSECWHGCIHIN